MSIQLSNEWQMLVKQHITQGLSRVQAIIAAAHARPDLYRLQTYIRESTPAARPAPPTPQEQQWAALVAQHQATGLSRLEALKLALRQTYAH